MHQDFLAAAEIDQVPDDEEIAGQVELFDNGQFPLDLLRSALILDWI